MKEEIITVGNVGYTSKVIVEQVTLRDQFAMAALTGLLNRDNIDNATLAAQVAYRTADAMLEARKEKK
jgi:hypothetical protein